MTRHDDGDGFGQRLSASGTAEFTDVVVDPEELTPVGQSLDDGSSIFASQAIFQFVHLGGLTGIARAVVRDAAAYVAGRTRGLDRHWRNARVLSSHNPLIYRARLLGDRAVNGTPLERHYRLGG